MTKTRNTLKVMGLVLTLVMVLSMLPVLSLTAFATDGSSNPWESTGDNDWYYYDENACAEDNCRGIYVSGECNVCGSSERTTQIINAWEKQNDNWYYYNPEGELATGWQQIEGEWYYFDTETGALDEEITSSGNNEWYYANDQLTSCDNDTCTGTYENGICSVCDAYQPATLNADGYYEIANAGQLYWFAQQVNGGNGSINGELTADIVVNKNVLDEKGELNGDGSNFREWTPIGVAANYFGSTDADYEAQTVFHGQFNGGNHTISGLYFNNEEQLYVGLFGATYGANISGVGVLDCYISGYQFVGGVVGVLGKGTLENCYNAGNVLGASSVGGVAGWAGKISTVQNCFNAGNVSGRSTSIGGVVGRMYNNATLKNCYSTGKVVLLVASAAGKNTTRGVVGDIGENTADNCFFLENTVTIGDAEASNGYVNSGTQAMSFAQFVSGEVAYKLGSAFGQTLEGENRQSYPVLGGETVYYGYTSCAEDAVEVYTNDSTASATKPAHTLTYTPNGNIITESCSANCGYCETATITADSATYNGTEHKTATVDYSEGWKGGELTVSYEKNTNAGTATASITIGEATARVDFTIAKATPIVTPPTPREGIPYTDLYFSLYETGAQTTGGTLMYKVNDGEWKITALDKWNAGTYNLYYRVEGDENYESVDTGAFITVTILQQELDKINPTVTLSSESFVYDGTEKTPDVSIITNLPYIIDGSSNEGIIVTLEKDKDFTVTYSDNVNAGTATVTIQGNGNFKGTVTKTFTINKAPLTITANDKTICVGGTYTLTYTVNGLVGNDTLTAETILSTDATVNTIGEYAITVSGATVSDNYEITYKNGTLTIRNHAYNGVVTTPPTCIAGGEMTYTCSHDSSHTYTEPIAVDENAHAYDNACDAICNTCGAERTPAEHYSENADGKCDECGESFELSGGAIAGIVIGFVAVLGGGGLALWWFVLRKKRII